MVARPTVNTVVRYGPASLSNRGLNVVNRELEA